MEDGLKTICEDVDYNTLLCIEAVWGALGVELRRPTGSEVLGPDVGNSIRLISLICPEVLKDRCTHSGKAMDECKPLGMVIYSGDTLWGISS